MEAFLLLTSEAAEKAVQKIPEKQTLTRMTELYKLFGDETRLRILTLLSEEELCVNDLAKLLSMTDSAVSHQLRVLRQGRLIQSEREGKAVVYALADDHVKQLLKMGLEHSTEPM